MPFVFADRAAWDLPPEQHAIHISRPRVLAPLTRCIHQPFVDSTRSALVSCRSPYLLDFQIYSGKLKLRETAVVSLWAKIELWWVSHVLYRQERKFSTWVRDYSTIWLTTWAGVVSLSGNQFTTSSPGTWGMTIRWQASTAGMRFWLRLERP